MPLKSYSFYSVSTLVGDDQDIKMKLEGPAQDLMPSVSIRPCKRVEYHIYLYMQASTNRYFPFIDFIVD